ncbi:aminopeptidase P family protein [Spirochaetia bacterium 38H-sp]|uniref:Aminopeptidase P family protein n=1 Tax=Rarispira pelagica TaxID=3141764 RepID=A0ABU9UC48_9SPIR
MEKLVLLRESMRRDNVSACIIADADPHNSEYPSEYYRARSWLSGFKGSNGLLLVMQERAGLWTDSRYFLEAEAVLHSTGIELFRMGEQGVPSWQDWLAEHVVAGDTVAADASCMSLAAWTELADRLDKKDCRLADKDYISPIWTDRPPLVFTDVWELPENAAGESSVARIKKVRRLVYEHDAVGFILSSLDEICWLLNIRAMDIAYNPLASSFLIVRNNDSLLFIKHEKLDSTLVEKLKNTGIMLFDYYEFFELVGKQKGLLLADFYKTPASVRKHISPDAELKHAESPVALLKARKNTTEIENMRQTLIADSRALVKFAMWLESEWEKGSTITEQDAAKKLEYFRNLDERFICHSFAPIVGFAAHGAIVHYNTLSSPISDMKGDGLLLVDSGGHYKWGTTDITRVFLKGRAEKQAIFDYTAVLKAHINLARAVFPVGLSGQHIDILARGELARLGLSYGHGTGHGVGYLLSVHEGPSSIRTDGAGHALMPGMILSNEPGLYRKDLWGIRLENLVLVKQSTANEFGSFLELETLTLFPFEPALVDFSMLREEEKDWLSSYHKTILKTLDSILEKEENAWLSKKCMPFIKLTV